MQRLSFFLFSPILIKSEMFVKFFIFQIFTASAFDVECENHCDSNLEKCLIDCGGNTDCTRLCVRERDRCTVTCNVRLFILKKIK